jgi:hypothetical protein
MEVSGQLHAPGRFTPRERAPGIHWIGGWVGPRTGLDMVSKWKIPNPRRESKPDHPIVQPVASRYTDWRLYESYTGSFVFITNIKFSGTEMKPILYEEELKTE